MNRTKRKTILLFGIVAVASMALLLISMIWSQPQAAHSAQTGQPPDDVAAAAFSKAGCAGCHTIPGVPNALGLVGPNLATIGSEAGSRSEGLDAEAYIRESILDPQAVIAPVCPNGDCPENVMLPNIAERLTDAELDAIVGYLVNLSGDGVVQAPAYELVPIEIVRPPEASITPFAEPPKTYEDAQVLLGKYLFFDPRISGDAAVSCASCHQPELAWTDGEALNAGYTGTGYFRNAPTIMNTGFRDFLYWDGRMDGEDMPTLVRDHIVEAHFMSNDGRLMTERIKQVPEYVQLYQDVYGSNPSFGGTLKAITAYVQSINSGITPYDNFIAGDATALSADAQAGLELFNTNCASCHGGNTFSDDQFYVNGVPDNGEIWANPLRHITFRRFFRTLGVPNYRALTTDPGLYALDKADDSWGAFRTAPLREVARTAPYMHNGVFATLQEVVTFYNDSRALEFNQTEMDQIVTFLESLSSEPVAVEVPDLPDYQLRTLGDNQ